MKFGILASHQFPQDANIKESIDGILGVVEYARDLNYDSVFTINHFVANLQTPQALSMTSKIIEISGRMQVGTGILILPLYHPVHIAEEFATLDHLSGGRVVLGVGAGYRDEEYEAFGIPKSERGGRLKESIEIIKLLWTGEPVHYEGKYYQLNGQKIGLKPLTPGGPPLWVGAGARAAVERAARLGDAWLTPGNTPNPDYFSKHLAIYDDARREAGLTIDGIERPIIKELYVAEDPEEARRHPAPDGLHEPRLPQRLQHREGQGAQQHGDDAADRDRGDHVAGVRHRDPPPRPVEARSRRRRVRDPRGSGSRAAP